MIGSNDESSIVQEIGISFRGICNGFSRHGILDSFGITYDEGVGSLDSKIAAFWNKAYYLLTFCI